MGESETDKKISAAVVAVLERRFTASYGASRSKVGWFVREFTDYGDGESFEALAGPFATMREGDEAAKAVQAKLIIEAIRGEL